MWRAAPIINQIESIKIRNQKGLVIHKALSYQVSHPSLYVHVQLKTKSHILGAKLTVVHVSFSIG